MCLPKPNCGSWSASDWAACIALVLSLGSLVWNTFNWLAGEDVQLLPPDKILIVRDGATDQSPIRVSLRIAYANTGARGYDGIVRGEKVNFTLGNRKITQQSQSIVKVSPNSKGNPNFDYIEDSGPLVVPAGSAVSREVYFEPQPIDCRGENDCNPDANFVSAETFVNESRSMEQIEFVVKSMSLDGDENFEVTCIVELYPAMIKYFETKGKGWTSQPCWRGGK